MLASTPTGSTDHVMDFDITEMANKNPRPLTVGGLGANDRRNQRCNNAEVLTDNRPLTWIHSEDESIVFPESTKSRTVRCSVCWRYRKLPRNIV